jgi:hypothetical protein
MLGVVEPKTFRLGPKNDPRSLGPKKSVKQMPKWKIFFEPME